MRCVCTRARVFFFATALITQVYKATDKAADLWSQYDGVPGASLWQLQMEHPARPSALFGRASFLLVHTS